MADGTLSPFVYWAQTETHVSLKIDLKNVKSPEVLLEEEELEFTATGCGARGQNEYHFVIEFFLPVDPKESHFRVSDRQVDFNIKKISPSLWPRLITQTQKPVWLKLDFDKWKPEVDDEDLDPADGKLNDLYNKYQSQYEKINEEDYSIGSMSLQEFRKLYLFIYNLFQLIGFTYIVVVMAVRYSRDGPGSMEGTYASVGKPMKFVTLLQFLEIIHPLLGYTKGSVREAMAQVLGRTAILMLMIDAEPRMQTKPLVFYLFFVWSLIELVRYPYYMLRVYDVSIKFLTWLRYTIWIPLYPLGFLCEGTIILRNIPYFEETKKFSIALPNKWNFSVDFPSLMRIYLLFLIFPMIYCMMTHMYRQRVKRIGPRSWQKKMS